MDGATASARAREEGNAFFRRGKWAAAAEAYTRAIDADPASAVARSNRAMAWLKLDRFADAAADARAALDRDDTVKARYRLALALRGLGREAEARSELEEVLRRDPGNGAAKGELDELRGGAAGAAGVSSRTGGAGSSGVKEGVSTTSTTSTTTNVAPVAAAAAETNKSTRPDSAAPTASTSQPAVAAAAPAAAAPSGFAALRDKRGARPGYVRAVPELATQETRAATTQEVPGPRGTQGAKQTQDTAPTAVDGREPSAAGDTVPPVRAPVRAQGVTAPGPQPSTSREQAGRAGEGGTSTGAAHAQTAPPAPAPPSDPTSTAPGTGLALLRALRALPPSQRWGYLQYYPASVVARVLAPVLEPDALGVVLGALDDGVSGGAGANVAAGDGGGGDAAGAVRGQDTRADGDKMDIDGDDGGSDDGGTERPAPTAPAPEAAAYALTLLTSLRRVPRYRMTAAMLSPAERAAGARAWAAAGGEGPWP